MAYSGSLLHYRFGTDVSLQVRKEKLSQMFPCSGEETFR
jgi:hypothetical protein